MPKGRLWPLVSGKRSAEVFRDAVCARDFAALDGVLARDADMRALLPGGLREYQSAAEVVAVFRSWFDDGSRISADAFPVETVGTRYRVGWRLRFEEDGCPARVVVQTAVVDAEAGRVYGLDLLCTGFAEESPASTGGIHEFDAGQLGCADGLAGEFRRRMSALPSGDVLRVGTRDPAAKEDLPPLARLLGHRVLGVEARPDGSTLITVERGNE